MKTSFKENYFLLTSPEEQLKEISFQEFVQKNNFKSPRINKKSVQKYAIDSWDISQKLKPFQTANDRYKQSLSFNLLTLQQRSKSKTKSVFLTRDNQSSHQHNFQSRKRCVPSVKDENKSLQFLNKSLKTIEKSKISVSSKEKANNTLRSKNKIEIKLFRQKEERIKTIKGYLTHQKDLIHRQRDFVHSQRVGKEGIQFCIYPTQYCQVLSKNSPNRKNNKKRQRNSLVRTVNNDVTKPPTLNLGFQQLGRSDRRIREQSRSTKSGSPKKRFQLFMDQLHKVTFD